MDSIVVENEEAGMECIKCALSLQLGVANRCIYAVAIPHIDATTTLHCQRVRTQCAWLLAPLLHTLTTARPT